MFFYIYVNPSLQSETIWQNSCRSREIVWNLRFLWIIDLLFSYAFIDRLIFFSFRNFLQKCWHHKIVVLSITSKLLFWILFVSFSIFELDILLHVAHAHYFHIHSRYAKYAQNEQATHNVYLSGSFIFSLSNSSL